MKTLVTKKDRVVIFGVGARAVFSASFICLHKRDDRALRALHHMNNRDLIRLGMIIFILSVNSMLAHYSGQPPKGVSRVFRAVNVGSYTILAMAALLWVRSALFGREEVKSLPQLSVKAAVYYVYGLGVLAFVSVYCLLNLSGSGTWFFATLTGLSVQDILERLGEPRGRLILIGLSSLFSVNVFAFRYGYMPDADDTWDAFNQGKVAEFVYSFVLPCAAPFIYLGIRGRRHYNPLTVMEFIYLAMPSAVHMSVMSLLITSSFPNFSTLVNMSLPQVQNESLTDQLVEKTMLVSRADVAIPLLSLMMIPTLFFSIQTSLLYSSVDFLAPAAAVAVFEHIAYNIDSSVISFIILAEGFFAIFLRLYICFMDASQDSGVVYTTEIELEENYTSTEEVARVLLKELDMDQDVAEV